MRCELLIPNRNVWSVRDARLFHTADRRQRSTWRQACYVCMRHVPSTVGGRQCQWQGWMMSSAKYICDWCTRHVTLYSTRRRTGSQCSWHSTCVMWSHCLVPVMTARRRYGLTVASELGRTIQQWVAVVLDGKQRKPEVMFWQLRLSENEQLNAVVDVWNMRIGRAQRRAQIVTTGCVR